MKNNRAQAVAVLIRSPDGTPLVMDLKKPSPRYWKLPGGKSIGYEDDTECAVREIREELGLNLDYNTLRVIQRHEMNDHIKTIFITDLPSLAGMRKKGDEHEIIKAYNSKDVKKLRNILSSHKSVICSYVE